MKKVTLLLLLLASACVARPSGGGRDVRHGPRAGENDVRHRRPRQADLEAAYASEYGVRLSARSRTTIRPSVRPVPKVSSSVVRTLDDVTNVSGVVDDVTRSSVGVIDDVTSIVPDVTLSSLSLTCSRHDRNATRVLKARSSGFIGSKASRPAQSGLLKDTPVSLPAPVTHTPRKYPGYDTLYYEVVEAHVFKRNASAKVKHPELGVRYPEVDLVAAFKKYALKEGIDIHSDDESASDISSSTSLKTKDEQHLVREVSAHPAGLSGAVKQKLPQPVIRQRLKSRASVANRPRVLTGVTANTRRQISRPIIVPHLAKSTRASATRNFGGRVVVGALGISGKQSTSALSKEEGNLAPAATNFHGSTRQTYRFNRFKYSAPILVNGKPDAFVYVDETFPQRRIVVSGTHVGNSGVRGGYDGGEDGDGDIAALATKYEGKQLKYTNSAPTVQGEVVHVYEDDESPPTQVVIPCNGCRSRLGFLSVVGDPSANDDDVQGPSVVNKRASAVSDTVGSGARFLKTIVTRDVEPETRASDDDDTDDDDTDINEYFLNDDSEEDTNSEDRNKETLTRPSNETQSKIGVRISDDDDDDTDNDDTDINEYFLNDNSKEDTNSGNRNKETLRRPSNETESRKGVRISGSYITQGPVGRPNLPRNIRFNTFGNISPPLVTRTWPVAPLLRRKGFLALTFVDHADDRSFAEYTQRLRAHHSGHTGVKRNAMSERSGKSFMTPMTGEDQVADRNSSPETMQERYRRHRFHLTPRSTVSRSSTTTGHQGRRAASAHRQRRATFQKIKVLIERRPVTSTPKPPPTLGQLTRGQRYTVLNDVHANIRKSRRMLTSTTTPQPNVTTTTTTTESNQELREQTLKMIRDLKDVKQALLRSASAEYKAALTAQLKKQLKLISDRQNITDEGPNADAKQSLNISALASEIMGNIESNNLTELVGTNHSSLEFEENVGGSTHDDTSTTMDNNLLNDSTNQSKINEAAQIVNATQSGELSSVKRNETMDNEGKGDEDGKEDEDDKEDEDSKEDEDRKEDEDGDEDEEDPFGMPEFKSRARQRQIKKAERNAELAMQLKEKLLQEAKTRQPSLVSDAHVALNDTIDSKWNLTDISATPSSPAMSASNASAMTTTIPKQDSSVGDLSNFGKALNLSGIVSNNANINDAPSSNTSTESMSVSQNSTDALQDYVDVGAPEDYLRHAMLYNAISDGTFLHVAEVGQEMPPAKDKPLEPDADTKRYPFGSALVLPKVVPADVDFGEYEENENLFGNEFDTAFETDSEYLLSTDDIAKSNDYLSTSNDASVSANSLSGGVTLGYNTEPKVSLPIEGNILPTSTKDVEYLKLLQAHLDVMLRAKGSKVSSQQTTKRPSSLSSEPGSKQRRPVSRPVPKDSSNPGRPPLHAMRAPASSSKHPQVKSKARPPPARGSGGRPRPGVNPVPADRPLVIGPSLKQASATSDDTIGSTLLSGGFAVDSELTKDLFSDLASPPRPSSSFVSGTRSRPRPRPRPHYHHGGHDYHHHGHGHGYGYGHRPPPRRPPGGLFRRMYHRMMHNLHHMMAGPMRYRRQRPARDVPRGGSEPGTHPPRGMGGLLGIYRGQKPKAEEDDSKSTAER